MERKSVCIIFVLSVLCLFLKGMAMSSVNAQVDPGATGPYTKCTYIPPANAAYAEAKVWYPCNVTGTLAATTLISGGTKVYSDYAKLAEHLASHGYIVFAMTPANPVLLSNSAWTSAQKAGILQLKKENTRTGTSANPNPIKGKINTAKLQVLGHSLGGGGTLLAAASLGTGIKTAQALTPAIMGSTLSLSRIKAKTNIIAGVNDTTALPLLVSVYYNSLPLTLDRTFMVFYGVDHWTFINTGAEPYQSRVFKYITAFMKYHLDGNTAYQTYLYGAEFNNDFNAGWYLRYTHQGGY